MVAPVSDNYDYKVKILDPSFVIVLKAEDLKVREVFGVVVHVGHPVIDLFVCEAVEG